MRIIFLILISFSSIINAGSFNRSNGVVSDSSTNLEWQDDYSNNHNSIKQTTWQDAINYCEALTLDGKSDWRLPNLNELVSLVDNTKYNPSINEVFQNRSSNIYWSSTTLSYGNERAWIVSFSRGTQFLKDKKDNRYIRCVRAGQ